MASSTEEEEEEVDYREKQLIELTEIKKIMWMVLFMSLMQLIVTFSH